MRKRKGDGVTSGTDAPESHRAQTRRSVSAWFAGVCGSYSSAGAVVLVVVLRSLV
ncbi:hypothetical protein [Escherichia coli]|uniref:hypothetical protein n=1 Tax=Escherichia coli TaxID=562 RepID=UPI00131EE192|nr:hypothetical protein [Escherichia coli]